MALPFSARKCLTKVLKKKKKKKKEVGGKLKIPLLR
jgi:hypothetical protein